MRFYQILSIMSATAAGFVVPAVEASSIEVTKKQLEKWVETKQILSKEANAWELDREYLQQSIELLAKELESLEADITEKEGENTAADEKRQKLLLERTNYFKADAVLAEDVALMEEGVRGLVQRFPDILQKKLERIIVSIPEDPEKTKLSLGQRLQNIVGILAQAEKFDKTATFSGETRDIGGGKELQVSTLYWGLSFAFYTDTLGENAGIGVPGEAGWVWTAHNDKASDIKRFIDIYEGNVDNIEFVPLPINIQ